MWYGVIFVVGICLVVAGLNSFASKIKLIKQGEITTATVVDVKRINNSEGDSYQPIFRYVTRENEPFTYEGEHYPSRSDCRIGGKGQIAYDPLNPKQAVMLTYSDTFGAGIMLLIVGLVALIVGGGYFVADSFFSGLKQQ